LAEILANCPDERLRDPIRAVALARRTVEESPGGGHFWSTLGMAHYRAGDWQAAIAALDQAVKLMSGVRDRNGFFLAMAHWQLGHRERARESFNQAVRWMETNRSPDELARRVRAEAEELLGLGRRPGAGVR
jgi:uncharacterized protein HemY